MMMYSVPSSLISLPEYLPNRMRSPTLTSRATSLPSSSRLPLPDGHHFALLRLFLGGIGDDDAVARGFLFLDPLHHDAVV